ncbi:protein misato [Anthonomus grandis grandis]|uniref:protein misato n=1 Tax=Anthonomus grandis grandis TaxID=2921223 RepID=UPI002164F989|nr:protein misato [Anthonomus grandis grandis]
MSGLTKEILTLQLGHYANFVGTHWWNIQETGFEYNVATPSEIDHEVLFREGLTHKGETTFTPRLLLVDLNGSLKTLPEEGDLYDTQIEPSQLLETVKWPENKLQLEEQPRQPKNEFQSDIQDPKGLQLATTKNYSLENEVTVWSDYLYTKFHPRTVNIVKEYEHCNSERPFDSFTLGSALSETEFFEDDIFNKIRMYVEECDHFQGFQMLTDCTNGFAGLSANCLKHLRDEYDHKSVLVLPTIPSYFPDNDYQNDIEHVQSLMNDSTRVINLLLAFDCYREFGSMFVPLCTSKDGWRQPGAPREFYHTNYNHKLPYHSSSILASALDTVSLKYRQKTSNFSLIDLCADLTGCGRKAAAASVCIPFSLNSDSELIDCLDQWQGPLYKSITPRCDIGIDRIMQHLTLRGIPDSRLKKASAKQKEMAAYKCNTVKEMMEFYLSCTTYATASNVAVFEKGMPTRNPFPDIFDKRLGVNGNVAAIHRDDQTRVDSIPILAGFHSGTEIGAMLESLHAEAGKLKIGRFHKFALEKDEYEESLNNILTLRENYEDSYLV